MTAPATDNPLQEPLRRPGLGVKLGVALAALPFIVVVPYWLWIRGPGDRILLSPAVTDPEHRAFHLFGVFVMTMVPFSLLCFLISITRSLTGHSLGGGFPILD